MKILSRKIELKTRPQKSSTNKVPANMSSLSKINKSPQKWASMSKISRNNEEQNKTYRAYWCWNNRREWKLEKLSCKGPDDKYFRWAGCTVYVATTGRPRFIELHFIVFHRCVFHKLEARPSASKNSMTCFIACFVMVAWDLTRRISEICLSSILPL